MSIRFIQSNYGKIDCYNVLKFLLDLTVIDLENVKPYEQGKIYTKGDYVHLKENSIHKIYRCKADQSSNTFIPDEWEHILDVYDEEVKKAGSIYIREEVVYVDKDNIDNIVISDYKPGTSIVTIYIDKDIYLNGRDFVIDENGKITFIPSNIVQIGDKVIIEIKESIGLPDRLIMLSSNGNNYEVGVIGEDVFIILSEFKYSKPEIFVKDSATDEVYKVYMIDEDICYELTDIYTSQTEIKILDVDRNPYILEMVNGEFFFSPKE